MAIRWLRALVCVGLVAGLAWIGRGVWGDRTVQGGWSEVRPGVLRSPGLPCGYALLDGDAALLIDAPPGADLELLRKQGVKKVEMVLLTHHHRDTCARAAELVNARIPVRASKAAADWLLPDGVTKYWRESLPLRNSRTAYLVVPEGIPGIDCSLQDGDKISWRGWTIEAIATPGHSRDHLAFAARKGEQPLLLCCGDALAGAGTLWSPYTTDWDHWTDLGLKPAGESLRKLAALKPAVVCPAHGEPIRTDAAAALTRTAEAVEEVAFLKSFERYSKERLGDAPKYAFLAREQAMTSGDRPWSKISEHLFLTGNTYVLVSRDNAILVVDPWGQRSVDQIRKLRTERKLGPIEVVLFSHAHYDHYDGIYDLPDRDKMQTWTLDLVAKPIAEPLYYRAPFVDARPVKIDRAFKDGGTATWREYEFRFHHLPGQSHFSMGVETTIDGKRCYFTADNFFHADQFSGTGGWMGLNRSWPLPYAASAQKVLDARPDWVLAEHGGAFVFDAEDFRRRVRWGEACARAADALCPSGQHRRDWDPHRIHVEPLVQRARAGAAVQVEVVAANPTRQPENLVITVQGRGIIDDVTIPLQVAPGDTLRRSITVTIRNAAPPGRHILPLVIREGDRLDGSDAFLGIEIEN
jgi:glyoxylase-like metal-dependent hydrolase (beta-lactamase superfamily II)